MTDKKETTKFKGIGQWRSQARKLEADRDKEPKKDSSSD